MRSSLVPSLALLLGTASALWKPSPHDWNPHGHDHGKPPCSEAVVALATGIHINIIGQYAEFNGTKMVQQVETEQAGNTDAFLIAKGQLESDIQGGMNIRLFNQEIAPPGNPAIPGLKKYAMAQETEKNLVAGLTGSYAKDKSAIDSLMSDIMTGIKLNQNNLKSVSLRRSPALGKEENEEELVTLIDSGRFRMLIHIDVPIRRPNGHLKQAGED